MEEEVEEDVLLHDDSMMNFIPNKFSTLKNIRV